MCVCMCEGVLIHNPDTCICRWYLNQNAFKAGLLSFGNMEAGECTKHWTGRQGELFLSISVFLIIQKSRVMLFCVCPSYLKWATDKPCKKWQWITTAQIQSNQPSFLCLFYPPMILSPISYLLSPTKSFEVGSNKKF